MPLIASFGRAADGPKGANAPGEMKPYGLPMNDYLQAQKILQDTAASSQVVKDLNAQIKELTDKRDDVLFSAAIESHPEEASKLSQLKAAMHAAATPAPAPRVPIAAPPKPTTAAGPTVTVPALSS
jgi:hypothetical protein